MSLVDPLNPYGDLEFGIDADELSVPLYPYRGKHTSPAPASFGRRGSNSRLYVKKRAFYYILSCITVFVAGMLLIMTLLRWGNAAFRPPTLVLSTNPAPGPAATTNDETWKIRAHLVKDAYMSAFSGYEKIAMPMDELKPLSLKGVNNFNGWGVTLVDSIDTMLIMEVPFRLYKTARTHVQQLDMSSMQGGVGFFETIIRYLGGFLAAYAMTEDNLYKVRAEELAELFLPVFGTASGLPSRGIDIKDRTSNMQWAHSVSLADMASFQMEFKYLAHITGKKVYFDKAEHVNDILQKHQDSMSGLLAAVWDTQNGTPLGAHWSMGAMSDSAYEYFLKQYLLSGKMEPKMLDMYKRIADGAIRNLLFFSPKRKLLFITDVNHGFPTRTQEHLACFFPGLLALGVMTLPMSEKDKRFHMHIAQGLTETCYLTYADQQSGLGTEIAQFEGSSQKWIEVYEEWEKSDAPGRGTYPPGVNGGDLKPVTEERGYHNKDGDYLLRPEVLESMFLMYRCTGDEIWRERAWLIFLAIEKGTKTEEGYASVHHVDHPVPEKFDQMPSYFMAETLKYLYLLFQTNSSLVSLDKYVLNTEAHPLPIFKWTEAQITEFGIKVHG